MRKPIKTKTYYNFMLVMKSIIAKGYDRETAEKLTHRIFDNYNPNGLPIWSSVDLILDKKTFDEMYK